MKPLTIFTHLHFYEHMALRLFANGASFSDIGKAIFRSGNRAKQLVVAGLLKTRPGLRPRLRDGGSIEWAREEARALVAELEAGELLKKCIPKLQQASKNDPRVQELLRIFDRKTDRAL